MNKPLILITNDDGIQAPGIRFLIEIIKDYGDIVVVAPNGPRSGSSHAISLESIITCRNISINQNTSEYVCSGTPVDCVKLALNEILDRKPDLCVSGINHGSNSSVNVVYSGTMSAALEAALSGVPAIGFSLLDFSNNADFTESEIFVRKVAKKVLDHGLDAGVALNINIPKSKTSEKIKGIKVCRQANAKWEEEFEKRVDPKGNKYYWLTGKFVNYDDSNDTDEWALSNHYVSLVPVQIDRTSYNLIPFLNNIFSDEL